VAPPANAYDFSFLAPCPSSGLIVHGANDDLVPEPSAAKLAQKLATQRNIDVKYQVIPGANHFFGTHLDPLTELVESYLNETPIARPVTPPPEPEMEPALP